MEIPFVNNIETFYDVHGERQCYQDPFSIYESPADCKGNSMTNLTLDSDIFVPFQDPIMASLYSGFPESSADPLDDIDPETLFYQKSFTELTPMRCELNSVDMLMMPQTQESSNYCSNPNVALGLEMQQKCSSLDDYNKENSFPNINHNSFYEHSNLQKFLPVNSNQDFKQETIVPNDFSQFEPYQDPPINFQEDFELQLLNTSPYPLTSEYINFEPPVYEGEHDAFETESNVSSSDSCSSTHESFHREPALEFGESSWVKEIKVGKNNRPRGPKCWEFLLRLLRDNASNPSLVKWENPDLGSFKLVEKDKISAIWGNRPSKKKNGKIIKYESFARILRYHYKKGSGMVLPVSEKHLVYKFASKVMAAYRAGKIL